MHEYSLHQDHLKCQGVDPNYVLCRIRKNERAKRKLKVQRELKQPNKKRIMAPDQLQPINHGVITHETIYNSNIMHDMTTHQDTSVVDHVTNMTTNQDNTNASTSLGALCLTCTPTNDEWKDIINLDELDDIDFSSYVPNNFDET